MDFGRVWILLKINNGWMIDIRKEKRFGKSGKKIIKAIKMLNLIPAEKDLTLLFLGAHSDDIEIGCGGTILKLIDKYSISKVEWVVFSGDDRRKEEAEISAQQYVDKKRLHFRKHEFKDGHFPIQFESLKKEFEILKKAIQPDLIFTHFRNDRHQDHRTISDITWNTFRNHMILEYEIPKWDGDLSNPNIFIDISDKQMSLKCDNLMSCFGTQRNKHWFSEETFRGLARLRGMECGRKYAEAFHGRKNMLF
jgi:LmbE family N-acetylglucosaminyl deacetylase